MAELRRISKTSPAIRSREIQLVTFEVGDSLYGLDIHVVKEINPNVALTDVPLAPPDVRGLVNIRGQVVLVLDLAEILRLHPPRDNEDNSAALPIPPSAEVVILKTAPELQNARVGHTAFDPKPFGDKPLALLVDRLGDVLNFSSERVFPAPSHVSEATSRHIEGVVELDDRLLIILNPAALLRGGPDS